MLRAVSGRVSGATNPLSTWSGIVIRVIGRLVRGRRLAGAPTAMVAVGALAGAVLLSGCSHVGSSPSQGHAPRNLAVVQVPVSLAASDPCQLLSTSQLSQLGVTTTVDQQALNQPGQCTYAGGSWAIRIASDVKGGWAYVTGVAYTYSPSALTRVNGLGDQAVAGQAQGGNYIVCAQKGSVGVVVAGSYPASTLTALARDALDRLGP